MRPAVMEILSSQQREVFCLLGTAAPIKEIARRLNFSARSVESYESRLKEALCLTRNAVLRRAAVLYHALNRSPLRESSSPMRDWRAEDRTQSLGE